MKDVSRETSKPTLKKREAQAIANFTGEPSSAFPSLSCSIIYSVRELAAAIHSRAKNSWFANFWHIDGFDAGRTKYKIDAS